MGQWGVIYRLRRIPTLLTLDTSSLHIVQECDPVQWNALVERAATGYITQTWEWGQLSYLGTMHRLAVANAAGDYVAAMSLIEERAPVIGRPYLYAPRGPVCDDPASPALPLLLQAAAALAQQRGCFMLKVEPQVEDGNAAWLSRLAELRFKTNPFATHPRRSWMLDIRPSIPDLLSGMQASSRYNINRGARTLVVREGQGPADRAIFYRLYSETAARDGFHIHAQTFYDTLMDLFEGKGAGVLHIVEFQGTPIAAHMAMRCGKVTTSMYSSSSNLHRNQRPNHPMQWAAIQWAKAHGCETYDFRAIAEVLEPDAELYSLYTYKRGYGGFSYLSLVTHDLPYQPALYWAYRQALRVKRHQDHQRHLAMLRERQAAKKPSEGEQG
jgi:lipid II:glycine glycyltransferase (peptidoglycan interpeptide bridge formation enzyme)